MSSAAQAVDFVQRFFHTYGDRRDPVGLRPMLDDDVVWAAADGSVTQGAETVASMLEAAGLSGVFSPVEGSLAASSLPPQLLKEGELWLVTGEARPTPSDGTGPCPCLAFTCLCRHRHQTWRIVHVHMTEREALRPVEEDDVSPTFPRDLLRTLTDNIPGGVHCCLYDEKFTFVHLNQAFLNLLGYTREELRQRFGNSLAALMYAPDRESTLRSIRAQLEASGMAEAEYRVPDSQGRLKWVIGKGRLIREHDQDILYCVLLDTTDLRHAQEKLHRTEARYRSALQATNLYVFESELPADTFQVKSPQRRQLFRKLPDRYSQAMEEATLHCHPEERETFRRLFAISHLAATAARGEDKLSMEFRLRDAEGRYTWYSLTLVLMTDERGVLSRIIGCLNDIDERKRRESQMLLSAQTDGLTGLYNKVCTEQLIRHFLADHPQEPHAFLLVDIDNFKAVNDNLGHLFGDAVLADIASKLKNLFRASDILGRIGGDEFVIFLKNVTNNALLMDKVRQLSEAFRRTYAGEHKDYAISCSIGIALVPRDGVLYGDLFRKADAALYQAKSRGKNGYCLYSKDTFAQRGLAMGSKPMTEIVPARSGASSASFQENLLHYVFAVLYEARDIDTVVGLILGMIGEHYGVSRAYVFENSPDNLRCSNTYEWCNKSIAPQKDNLQNLAYEDVDNFFSMYTPEGVFYCRDIDDLPPASRKILQAQGIRSMLHVAIFDERRTRGFVGFDECGGLRLWTKDEIETLTLLAKIVGIFVLKRNISARLEDAYNNSRAILDSLSSWAYVIDQTSHELLYLNEATRQFVPQARIGQKCYEAFFSGASSPCPLCPMQAMLDRNAQRATQEIPNVSLGVWTEATASRIPWAGRGHAILLSCVDITRYKTVPEHQPGGQTGK